MEKNKRYMVFGYADYYPNGGILDCISSFDTFEEALKAASDVNAEHGNSENIFFYENLYIYDRIEGVTIWDRDNKNNNQ